MKVDDATYQLLNHGEIVSCELTPAGSNYTFLAKLNLGDSSGLAIYKPKDGEIPLWDFPSGTLYKRECAAYILSDILEWDFIPYTIIRDGPYGIGSVQQFIYHDTQKNYYTLDDSNAEELRTIACFDLVANNTDRKAGHMIVDNDGKVWGIDQGLTFHSDTKIRTVIWDFSDEPIPEHHLDNLETFRNNLSNPTGHIKDLLELLSDDEIIALSRRLDWVLAEKFYPGIPGRRRS